MINTYEQNCSYLYLGHESIERCLDNCGEKILIHLLFESTARQGCCIPYVVITFLAIILIRKKDFVRQSYFKDKLTEIST